MGTYSIITTVKRKETAPGAEPTESGKKGGGTMYTDYGYEADGIEYATMDEASEDT
jgi:hypothetical protein